MKRLLTALLIISMLFSGHALTILAEDANDEGWKYENFDPNWKKGLNLISLPAKRNYIVGEDLDLTGLKIINFQVDKYREMTDFFKLVYYATKERTMSNPSSKERIFPDEPFKTKGTKVVTIRNVGGDTIAEFTVTVFDKAGTAYRYFVDVPSGAYYENPVIWASKYYITSGTSIVTFSPNDTCTRGQVVTFLWRAQGQPEPASQKNPFKDVSSKDYYYKAVLWAVQNGITSGTSATTFGPNETCTNGQVVTFLWRANGSQAANGTSSLASQYNGQYYTDAVAWADSIGLLSGTGKAFKPENFTSRADIVTYLYRNAGSPYVQY